jgi:hypothetical protein
MYGIELLRFSDGDLDFFYYINNKFIRKTEKICDLSLEELINFKEHCNERSGDKNMTGYIFFYDNIYIQLNKELLNRRINKIVKLKERIYESRYK